MAHESILIVEDEPLAARYVQILLERLHYTVAGTAATGEDAIELVKNGKPDLILMDIALKGGIDGIQTAHQLKKLVDIPVVFLTAFADMDTLERAKLEEPYGYLVKPFKAEDLASSIRVAITKHAMDRQLRQSHKRYLALVQNISDGVLLYKADGTLQLCNKQASELTGVPEQALFLRSCRQIDWNALDADGRALANDDLPFVRAIERHEAVHHAVVGFPRPGGEGRTWVIVNVEPTRSASTGEPEYLATITDITTLKGTELALQQTQTLSDTMLANFPNGVVALWDKELRCVRVDGLELAELGIPREKIEGRLLGELLSASLLPVVESLVFACLRGEYAEEQLVFKDREYRVIALPVREASGGILSVLTMAQNITDRSLMLRQLLQNTEELEGRVEERTRELRQALDTLQREQEHREQAMAALRESEERFKGVFDSTSDGIIVCDLDGNILFVNTVASRDIGFETTALVGSSIRTVQMIPFGLWEKSLAGAENEAAGDACVSLRSIAVIRDRARHLDFRSFPIVNPSGAPFAISIVYQDVSVAAEAEMIMDLDRRLAHELSTVSEISEVGAAILHAALRLEGVDGAGLYMVDEADGGLTLLRHAGLSDAFIAEALHYPPDSRQFRLVQSGTPVYIDNAFAHPDVASLYRSEGLLAVGVVPIQYQGRALACLNFASKTGSVFSPQVRKGLETIAALAGGTITRAKAVSALRRSEERYRGVVDSQGELIFLCDADARFTFVNDAICEVLGKTPDEMLGADITEFAVAEDLPVLTEAVKRLVLPPHREQFETRVLTKEGPCWFQWDAVAFLDEAGALREVQTVGRDVSELRRKNESNLLFSLALQNTNDLVMIVDVEQHVWFANAACRRAFGFEHQAIEESAYRALLEGVRPDTLVEIQRGTRSGGWNGILRATKPDGTVLPLKLSTSVVLRPDGSVFGFLGIGRDITEELAAEERDQEMQLFAAFGRMATMVAHEIKTPLTSIKMNFDMLREDLRGDARAAQSLAIIEQELARLQTLVHRSLDITNLGLVIPGDVEIRSLLEDVHRSLRNQMERRRIVCIVEAPVCALPADRELLRSVVSNLIVNAMEAIGEGGTISVTAQCNRETDRLECRICDSGPGIPPEMNVFKPFTTTKSGGSGLGLISARRICEQHGGSLVLESSRRGQTVFKFELPLHSV